MGFLPRISESNAQLRANNEFRGYNHNVLISDSEFYDMKNMTGERYPALSTRNARGLVRTFSDFNGIKAADSLYYVDGTSLYKHGTSDPVAISLSDSEKTLIPMGALLLIFPDKKIYNTASGELNDMGNTVSATADTMFSLCKFDGTVYEDVTAAETPPSAPAANDLWLDTSQDPNVLKQYSEYSASWVAIPTTYIKIASAGIGTGFSDYDGVTISGCENDDFNTSLILQKVAADDSYIVVIGTLDANFTQSYTDGGTPLTIERKVPDMDFYAEWENRLWGCSSANHEIYACKQGDPTNFYCYAGISTDSYAATVGTPGDFTGACAFGGYVMFFKEDYIHRVYGNKPSNFSVSCLTDVEGVETGSSKSIAVANNMLFYKGRSGIIEFSSGACDVVSNALGIGARYSNVVAGALGDRYYFSAKDRADAWHLFVLDASSGMIHREDDTHAKAFARFGGELYFVNSADQLYSVRGTAGTLESNIEFMAQTGEISLNYAGKQRVSKFQYRAEVDKGALLKILAAYDGSDDYRELTRISPMVRRTVSAPVIPQRCESIKLRLTGHGSVKVYASIMTVEGGSEL